MSSIDAQSQRHTAVDTIAGLMAMASLVLSGIACGLGLLLELEAHPTRMAIAAVILAIAAGRMSVRHERLSLVAACFAGVAWVIGMTLMVLTGNPVV